jgi:hypothetical protein
LDIEGAAVKRETAAELQLTVGGVAVGGAGLIRPLRRSTNSSGYCCRHDYAFDIAVRNLGNERLSGYHVDVEFPTRALEHPETHGAYVRGRSTKTLAFFRASNDRAAELFPDDAPVVLSIPYYVDDAMFWNRDAAEHVYEQRVRVTLYQPGLPPVTVEMQFERLSNF